MKNKFIFKNRFSYTNLIIFYFNSHITTNLILTAIASFYFILISTNINLDQDFLYLFKEAYFMVFVLYCFDAFISGLNIFKNHYLKGKQSYLRFSGLSRQDLFFINLIYFILYILQKYLIFILFTCITLCIRENSNLIPTAINVFSNIIFNYIFIFLFFLLILFFNETLYTILLILFFVFSFTIIIFLSFTSIFINGSYVDDSLKNLMIFIKFLESCPFFGMAFAASLDHLLVFKILNYLFSSITILILLPLILKKNKFASI